MDWGRFTRISGIIFFVTGSIFSLFLTQFQDKSISKDEFKHESFLAKVIATPNILESIFYDFRLRQVHRSDKKSQSIVLAAIDDESLQKIERWPWTRTKQARLTKKFKNFGAKVIAWDVVYPEESTVCPGALNPDEEFAKAMIDFRSNGKRDSILGYKMVSQNDPEAMAEMPIQLYNMMINAQVLEEKFIRKSVSKHNFPIDKFTNADIPVGYISADQDYDGIFRQYPIAAFTGEDSILVPSLGLMAYKIFSDGDLVIKINGEEGYLKTSMGIIPMNKKGETKVRWFGDESQFDVVPIHKVYFAQDDDPEMKKLLQDKIVFIGSTSFGAHDFRSTPLDPLMPGVFVHMNFVQMLLDGHFFQPRNISIKISALILGLGFLILLLTQLLKNPILDFFLLVMLLTAIWLLDIKHFLPQGHELKLFTIFLAFNLVYIWNTIINFYYANKEKKQIKGTFSRYVAPSIVDEMLANPDQLKVGGERKNITCIFSDVRDFTSISEQLTPEQLSNCLNQYMGKMTDILFDTYGTLDKYIGDAIVGYWGAPLPVKDHAYHGVRGSLEMIEALPAINDTFREQGFPEFRIGIGLNTGDCSLGNMGSDKIFSYTALGDNMNLGARLEGLCKFYGSQLMISEYTYHAIPEQMRNEFTFRPLDNVRVKGKEKAVSIIEVLHSFHDFMLDRETRTKYTEAYQCYQNKEFKRAVDILIPIKERYPNDIPTGIILTNCEEYLKNPPPADWDGATTYQTK